MATAATSLRSMVEDWMAPNPEGRVRVSRFGRSKNGRYVCVESVCAANTIAMFFFRHRDGTWCVFPPDPERPTMRIAEILHVRD